MKFFGLFIIVVLIGACQKDKHPFRNPTLPLEERIEDLLNRLTPEEKLSLLHVTAPAIPRLGIDAYHYGNEALHGIVRRNGRATVFPMAIAMAASWNPGLIQEVATAISDEARAKHNASGGKMSGAEEFGGQFNGLLTFFSPTINMARDPRWGRTAETYGEDPFLTSQISVAFIQGMQGDHPTYLKTICTPKHFVANNEEHNRYRGNAEVSEKTLREYYFPAYRNSVIEGKAGAIMSAYNAINGIPCSANEWLLSDVLRNEWQFEGYVVCDCGAIKHLYESHKYVGDSLMAAVKALKAGVDLECGGKMDLTKNLPVALEKGLIKTEDINQAVRRILRGRFLLGMFDPPGSVPFDTIHTDMVGHKKHVELALQSARESIVLLKNEGGIMPLDSSGRIKILVVGPNANVNQFGEPNYTGVPLNPPVNPLEGIKQYANEQILVNHVIWKSPADANKFRILRFPQADREEAFTGEYFDNPAFNGKPQFKRKDLQIDFDWDNEAPDPFITTKEFSARWKTTIKPEINGEYVFRVTSNDSVVLKINKETLISRRFNGQINAGLDTATVVLKKEQAYEVEVFYSNSGCCDPLVRLEWKEPYMKEFDEFADAEQMAREHDVVVAVMGLDSHTAVERFDRETLDLPSDQGKFIKRLYQVNNNMIVVLINGNPLAVNWMDEHVPGIVEAWFPGEQGGTAIAEVLFGKVNPSGKLPLTFYRSTDQLPPFSSYEISKGHTYMFLKDKPLYPFGHGLSYTNFSYDLDYNSDYLYETGDTIRLNLILKNTGGYDGNEVIQIYYSYLEKTEYPEPLKKLIAFQKVFVESKDERLVDIEIPVNRLQVFDEKQKKHMVRSGSYDLILGSSSEDEKVIVRVDVE